MPYGPDDESFIHQLPTTLDHVHDSDKTWSDRCYFETHAEDGSFLLAMGYGNNPNVGRAMGYAKLSLADGRHWDLDVARELAGDRDQVKAGPLVLTCVEPLKRWKLQLLPNPSGVEWELYYEPRAPMWELKPILIYDGGRKTADMYHMKEAGTYTGWYAVDGERTTIDGLAGGRDRTFGVRVSEDLDFWLWYSIEFEDKALEAYVFETSSGEVLYCDGGIVNTDGSVSKRFVKHEHDIRFDGDRKRITSADLLFVDEDGAEYRLSATSPHVSVNTYYGAPSPNAQSDGELKWLHWNANDDEALTAAEDFALALDQVMQFDLGGAKGTGILEMYSMGDGYHRYPNWPASEELINRIRSFQSGPSGG